MEHLPNLEDNIDPFKDIDSIETADKVSNNLFVIKKMYVSQQNLDDNDSDWEDDDGNIFDIFIEDDEGAIRPSSNSLSLCVL